MFGIVAALLAIIRFKTLWFNSPETLKQRRNLKILPKLSITLTPKAQPKGKANTQPEAMIIGMKMLGVLECAHHNGTRIGPQSWRASEGTSIRSITFFYSIGTIFIA